MLSKKIITIKSYELFFIFHSDMKPYDTKRQVTTQKNKMI